MRHLRSGQDTVLSWSGRAVECKVVAAAGRFVLLRPERRSDVFPFGKCSLTYLAGMVPMGWDGTVEPGAHEGEWRFHVAPGAPAPERRSSVRLPVMAPVAVRLPDGEAVEGSLLDISAGGVRFRHAGRIDGGTMLRVTTTLPDGLHVDADAVVRTSEPGVTSLEFLAMHAADSATVGAWVVDRLRSGLS
jgi:hypothetical protein